MSVSIVQKRYNPCIQQGLLNVFNPFPETCLCSLRRLNAADTIDVGEVIISNATAKFPNLCLEHLRTCTEPHNLFAQIPCWTFYITKRVHGGNIYAANTNP